MLIVPPIPFLHRRRLRVKRAPVVTELELLAVENIDAPGPEISYDLVFNTSAEFPLLPTTSANPEQWIVRYNNMLWLGAGFSDDAFDRIRMYAFANGAETGPNAIVYLADPSDIGDTRGRWLAAIDGRPI